MLKISPAAIDVPMIRRGAVAIAAAVVCVGVGVIIGSHGSERAITLFGYVAAALSLVAFYGVRSRAPAPVIPERIRQALTAHRWNRAEAARQLGMHRTTLWRKMREYGL